MEPGERAQRRRQIILAFSLLLLVVMQSVAIQAADRIAGGVQRAVDVAQVIAPVFVALGLLRGFLGAPMWISAPARRSANDELTADNRRRAMVFGTVCTVTFLSLLCVAAPFTPLQVLEVLHGVLFIQLASSILRFVWLEKRGSEPSSLDASQ